MSNTCVYFSSGLESYPFRKFYNSIKTLYKYSMFLKICLFFSIFFLLKFFFVSNPFLFYFSINIFLSISESGIWNKHLIFLYGVYFMLFKNFVLFFVFCSYFLFFVLIFSMFLFLIIFQNKFFFYIFSVFIFLYFLLMIYFIYFYLFLCTFLLIF